MKKKSRGKLSRRRKPSSKTHQRKITKRQRQSRNKHARKKKNHKKLVGSSYVPSAQASSTKENMSTQVPADSPESSQPAAFTGRTKQWCPSNQAKCLPEHLLIAEDPAAGLTWTSVHPSSPSNQALKHLEGLPEHLRIPIISYYQRYPLALQAILQSGSILGKGINRLIQSTDLEKYNVPSTKERMGDKVFGSKEFSRLPRDMQQIILEYYFP